MRKPETKPPRLGDILNNEYGISRAAIDRCETEKSRCTLPGLWPNMQARRPRLGTVLHLIEQVPLRVIAGALSRHDRCPSTVLDDDELSPRGLLLVARNRAILSAGIPFGTRDGRLLVASRNGGVLSAKHRTMLTSLDFGTLTDGLVLHSCPEFRYYEAVLSLRRLGILLAAGSQKPIEGPPVGQYFELRGKASDYDVFASELVTESMRDGASGMMERLLDLLEFAHHDTEHFKLIVRGIVRVSDFVSPPFIPLSILSKVLRERIGADEHIPESWVPTPRFSREFQQFRGKIVQKLQLQQSFVGEMVEHLLEVPFEEAPIWTLGYSSLVWNALLQVVAMRPSEAHSLHVVVFRNPRTLVHSLQLPAYRKACEELTRKGVTVQEAELGTAKSLAKDRKPQALLLGAGATYPMGAFCERGARRLIRILRSQRMGRASRPRVILVAGRYKYARVFWKGMLEVQAKYHETVKLDSLDAIVAS